MANETKAIELTQEQKDATTVRALLNILTNVMEIADLPVTVNGGDGKLSFNDTRNIDAAFRAGVDLVNRLEATDQEEDNGA